MNAYTLLESLVKIPQEDTAIAIDETFLKIHGKSYYIILAVGYSTRKVLGIRVSRTRTSEDIRVVFDEAESNTSTSHHGGNGGCLDGNS